MIYGLIPAAGHSRRMGRPKLSLHVGGRPILDRVIASLKSAGVSEVLVVVGPQVQDLCSVVDNAGAHYLLLDEETADMRETVMKGLIWLEKRFHPRPDDGWLLVPGDHATLNVQIIQQIISAFDGKSCHSICLPVHEGQRGHPTLLSWQHVQSIRDSPAGEGLNQYIRNQSEHTKEIVVTSPSILEDLDTPQDYEKLLGGWNKS